MLGLSRLLALVCGTMLAQLAVPVSATAQQIGGVFDTGDVQSSILVVEFDRLFTQSAFGQRFTREAEAESANINAQNRAIEAELTEEERQLTEQRSQMEPAEFRALADAFDEKVQRLRDEQDAKARALGQRSDEERRRFLAIARPVIDRLMQESGATIVLDRRAVFLSADFIDITDQAIERIDRTIGDGAAPEQDQ